MGVLVVFCSACAVEAEPKFDSALGDDVGVASHFQSPLADFLGPDIAPDPDDNLQLQRQRVSILYETVELCMRRHGFEYEPQSMIIETQDDPADNTEYGSRDWIKIYGFGISTTALPQSELGPKLRGFDDSALLEHSVEFPYLESLSKSEVDEYMIALHGSDPTKQGGCAAEGNNAIAEIQAPLISFTEQFGDVLAESRARTLADPRVIELQNDIAECVQRSGFDYTSSRRSQGAISQQLEEFRLKHSTASTLDSAALGELEALQRHEIALALTEDACQGSPRYTSTFYNEIQAEYELKFIEQHREKLNTFLLEHGGN